MEPEQEGRKVVLRLRRERKTRAILMAAGALVVLLFSSLLAFGGVSAEAGTTQPTVTPVYQSGNSDPAAYLINTPNGPLYFCSRVSPTSVFTCQQLPGKS